jgi:hypothetical protein
MTGILVFNRSKERALLFPLKSFFYENEVFIIKKPVKPVNMSQIYDFIPCLTVHETIHSDYPEFGTNRMNMNDEGL